MAMAMAHRLPAERRRSPAPGVTPVRFMPGSSSREPFGMLEYAGRKEPAPSHLREWRHARLVHGVVHTS